MPIEPGRQLLHYRLIEKIGEGGMGVVWSAEDITLKREVAIKILPDALAADAERLARFGREARLLATLNHPNIAAIYGLHEAEGAHFLAMELVRGEDLSERIARGPLPVDDALDIARVVADALRNAHGSGVIHRDLKPANIRLGPDGEVKVLDFGLAKMLSQDDAGSSPGSLPSLSPTVTSLGTVAGVLLGTAAYMSPEQARGKAVDKRADIWAFGCVLFEMLTGKLVFHGETITDTLAAVVRGEPDWERLPADVPSGVRRVLQLCLVKNPRDRLHDIADATLLMDSALEEVPGPAATDVAPDSRKIRFREGLAWMLAAGAIVTAIVMAVVLGSRPAITNTGAPTRFGISLAAETPLSFIDQPILAFSPDGRKIAFTAQHPETGLQIIYLRALDQSEPWPLPGTEGGSSPFFSPDGEHLGFFSAGELKRISLSGGSATTLARAPNPRGGVWLPDNSILYSPEYTSGLWRIPASGGSPQPEVEPDIDQDERTFRWPTALPGGKAVLFTVGSVESPNNYDQAGIAAFSFEDGTRKDLLERANMARFIPPDKLIFSRSGALYAVGFDPARLELLGDPVQVKDGVGGDPSSGASYFDVSPAGDLIYVAGVITDARANLVLIDRDGNASALPLEPRGFRDPRFAPDGSSIAFTVGRASDEDVWVFSLTDGGLRRVTFGGLDRYPLWQSDGARIAFVRGADTTIVAKGVDGSGEDEPIVKMGRGILLPSSWSPDHRTMALTRTARTTDVYLMTLGDDEPRLFAEDASGPVFSPDGRWLAYASPASGLSVVYVRPVEGESKWQVSPDSGSYPRWSPDGRKLFFIDATKLGRPLMEVDVAEGETFRCGMPRVLLGDLTRYATATAPRVNWDTDGERFAFVEVLRDDEALLRIEVTLDWAQQLSLTAAR